MTAVTGKIELVYEGEQQGAQIVARKIIGEAVKEAFRRRFPDPSPPRKRKKRQEQDDEDEAPVRPEKPAPSPYQTILAWFSKGNRIETSDEMPQREYVKSLESVDGLAEIAARFLPPAGSTEDSRGLLASAMELVLEGLHQHSMISKWEEGGRTAYRDMLKAMFDRMPVSDSN